MRLPPSVHHTHQLHHTPQTAMEVTGHAGVDSGMTALGDQARQQFTSLSLQCIFCLSQASAVIHLYA